MYIHVWGRIVLALVCSNLYICAFRFDSCVFIILCVCLCVFVCVYIHFYGGFIGIRSSGFSVVFRYIDEYLFIPALYGTRQNIGALFELVCRITTLIFHLQILICSSVGLTIMSAPIHINYLLVCNHLTKLTVRLWTG